MWQELRFVNVIITYSRNDILGLSFAVTSCPTLSNKLKKVKLSLQQAVKSHKVLRCWGSHIFYTIGSLLVVNLSASCPGSPQPPGRVLVLISVSGWVDPRAIVRLEGLGQLKNPMTWSVESTTFRLVAYCLNQLRYHVPLTLSNKWLSKCKCVPVLN
jgi:hypothetical protein